MICLDHFFQKDKIWICKYCKILTHLKCVKEWVELRRQKFQENENSFECFHCNAEYHNQKPEHTCYCGKIENPVFNPYHQPNSCGQICNQNLSKFCDHLCEKICHSGQCPDCNKENYFDCYCGSKKIMIKCKDYNKFGEKTCGKKCQKLLECNNHICQQICHEGSCKPCDVKEQIQCYCGKITKEVDCGFEYSCQQKCNKLLDCGKHHCQLICHEGECQQCPNKVIENEKCHCGQKLVKDILGHERNNCLEEIPSCQQLCYKGLGCDHLCILKCHKGQHDCGNIRQVQCKCGTNTIKRQCNISKDYYCDKICNRKKDCQRHVCNNVCCIGNNVKKYPNFEDHKCQMICGRILQCKKHQCTQKCHKGKCQPCDVMINRPLTCACGQEVLKPPQICGTEIPVCFKVCNKQLPCGHNCYKKCHYGECGECQEMIFKQCQCGQTLLDNALCSKPAKCMKFCQEILICGHKCKRRCHQQDKCYEIREKQREKFIDNKKIPEIVKNFYQENNIIQNSCLETCGKLKSCGHECALICHPNIECPDIYCPYQTEATCKCGNLKQKVDCGQQDNVLIECNEKCKNLQRFKALYEKEKDSKRFYYSIQIVKFGKKRTKYVKKIEDILEKMYFQAENSVTFKSDINNQEKIDFLSQLLQNHYKLNVSNFVAKNKMVFKCFKTDEFMIPTVSLSQYLKMIKEKKINKKNKPFEIVFKFFNLTMHNHVRDLRDILQDYNKFCYIEKNQNGICLYLWEKYHQRIFEEKLKSLNNNWSIFTIENITNKKSNKYKKQKVEKQKSEDENYIDSQEEDEDSWQVTQFNDKKARNKNQKQESEQSSNIFNALMNNDQLIYNI